MKSAEPPPSLAQRILRGFVYSPPVKRLRCWMFHRWDRARMRATVVPKDKTVGDWVGRTFSEEHVECGRCSLWWGA